MLPPDQLSAGHEYSWDTLAEIFGFKPAYFSAAGGMPVSSATDSLLLITHPNGGKSFDYKDYWDGEDLIYTGRGKRGDQSRTAQNLDAGENRRALYVFEAAGPSVLRFLGEARCVEERTARAPDDDGLMRNVLQFRLRFSGDGGAGRRASASPAQLGRERERVERRPRPFDPDAVPAPARTLDAASSEEKQALAEKANQGHHRLLVELNGVLQRNRWSGIEEIPAAIDLRGHRPGSAGMVIFEAKTLTDANELAQTRSGLAQLFEYRAEYGGASDALCLVTDRPVSLRRAKLLDELGIGLVTPLANRWQSGNDCGSELIADLS